LGVWRDEKFGLAEIRGLVFWNGIRASGGGKDVRLWDGGERTQRKGRGTSDVLFMDVVAGCSTRHELAGYPPQTPGWNENTKTEM